jgi:hypothetical protein
MLTGNSDIQGYSNVCFQEPDVAAFLEHLPASKMPTYSALQAEGSTSTTAASSGGGTINGGQGHEEGKGLESSQQDACFQAFAESVLESMVLSLVQESAAGDWEET